MSTKRYIRAFALAFPLCGALMSPVVMRAQMKAEVEPPHWRGALTLTIGGASVTDEALTFGDVVGITVDAAGRVFVADGQDQQIRVFSPTGAFVAKIGRKGAGPVEFSGLGTIAFSADGMLWVRDERNGRFQILDVRAIPAKLVRTVPLLNHSSGSLQPITFDVAGNVIDEWNFFDAKAKRFRPSRIRLSSTGVSLQTDTLPIPIGADAGEYKIVTAQKSASGTVIGTSEQRIYQPNGPQWVRAYGARGARADVVSSRYDVSVFDDRGTLVRHIVRTVSEVPLSEKERATGEARLKSVANAVSASAGSLPFGVPRVHPPLVGLAYATDGTLWVERTTPDGQPREADVFDTNGRRVATAEWPRELEVTRGRTFIGNRYTCSLAMDSDQVERVVCLRFK